MKTRPIPLFPAIPLRFAFLLLFPVASAAGDEWRLEPGVRERGAEPAAWEADLRGLDAAAAKAAFAGLSRHLYGSAEQNLHQPLILRTAFPADRVLGLEISVASSNGANLQISIDGKVAGNENWPIRNSPVVGRVYYLTLPAGERELRLEVSRNRTGFVAIDACHFVSSPEALPQDPAPVAFGKGGAKAADPASFSEESGQPTRPGDGYRGIWFTLGQFTEHGDKYSGGLGTYTANHIPLAVYAPEVERTFFVYGGTRPGERHLLIMIGSFDHLTGRVSRPWIVHDKHGVDDPHDNPSLALDDGGHLWVFVSGRGRSRPGYIYRSRRPWDITDFEFVAAREMTYPQPWFVPGRGFLLLFTKYTKGRELYFSTSPDGRVWGEDVKLAGLEGHYQVSGPANDQGRIGTFFNRHPKGSVDHRTDLYYLETPDFGRTWTTAGGTPVELPVSEVDSPARAIDYAAQGRLQYTCDLGFDERGHPVLLYVTSADYRPGPPGDPRWWTVARWDGAGWTDHPVTRAGHNYDMGSLYIEGPVWRILGPTGTGPQPLGTGGEMAWWRSDDSGKTWRLERQVTRASEFNHGYARRPLRARDPFFAFWADGNPDRFSPSRLYFTDRSGERVWMLPEQIDGDDGLPIEWKPPGPSSSRTPADYPNR